MALPPLAGLSRKSMLGELTGAPVQERVHASVAAAMLAIQRGCHCAGARCQPTRDVIKVMEAIAYEQKNILARMVGAGGLVSADYPDFVMRLGYAAGKVLASD